VTIRRAAGALGLAAALGAPLGAAEHQVAGLVDLRLIGSDAHRVWLEGGLDKSRFGDGDEPLVLGGVLLDYTGRFTPGFAARVTLAGYDGTDEPIDVLEAYAELRPVPRSASRWRARLGWFYPPVSLESSGTAWTSPYTLSFSAINTWIGEEIRSQGAEVEWTRMGRFRGSPHDLSAVAGVVRQNDPAGALISWRGWALHDRQTGLIERLPLADLPAFRPQGSFPPQEAFEEPFRELDGRVGWYAGAGWDGHDKWRLRALHYDNRGDPGVVEGGQWAWLTRFDHVGLHLRPLRRFDVVAQALEGDTRMDGFTGPLVDVEFRSAFVLGSHTWRRHRISLRYDTFEVDDRDATPDDPNGESGQAWTAAYFFTPQPIRQPSRGRLELGAELLQVSSERPARALLRGDVQRTETTAQLALRWHF
jgi:hypothetical protein